ncbi:F-box/FBD/LRR-repeat protein [Raphanus sativus]|uniref:FBD-associated F-box protein At5g56410 n=1 Tax=Raphanus sativus TaxID=3726 RepID=A0A9W3DKB8_RAPSA|nr:putative FBD-associated F-box protein At5g56410 [Raphanus sativus]KAJ4902909.1 F-box/FBD/LRR-repeat protein [Raphanus sativus]
MDSFGELTDDLLIKILSFAPTTKVAVATSVLSKRWLSLWTMVPRLSLEDQWIDTVDINEIDFIVLPSHAVSGTLLLHKSPVIESFHLTKASGCIDDSEIYLWVRVAVDRFVRDLKISFTDAIGL